MIDQFVYDIPTRILYGAGSLQKLHEENLPGKKALIAISQGGSMKRHGQLDALMSELDAAGVSYVLFDQIRPNPTAGNVDDAAACAVREGCDFVVALGGGSVMDAAKAIALVATNEGSCWDYAPLRIRRTAHARGRAPAPRVRHHERGYRFGGRHVVGYQQRRDAGEDRLRLHVPDSFRGRL